MQHNQPEEQFLTAKQVARVFQVSERTVRRWTDAGRLACVKLGTGARQTVRYSREHIDQFAREHTRGREAS